MKKDILLTIDVGNTAISLGFWEGKNLLAVRELPSFRLTIDKPLTAEEYSEKINKFMEDLGLVEKKLIGIVLSSVVPAVSFVLKEANNLYFSLPLIEVTSTLQLGLKYCIEKPSELGADLIVSSFAAGILYHLPCLIIDFGTATTFSIVSAKRELLGGAIAPGIRIMAKTLWEETAQLPEVALEFPPEVLCKNTVTCMQAGILYGYIGLVEGLINRFKTIFSLEDLTIIATGGHCLLFKDRIPAIHYWDPELILKGLQIIGEMFLMKGASKDYDKGKLY